MPREQLYQGPIIVKKSPIHGYGVFALKDMAEGELVEECYALLTTHFDMSFYNYYFRAENKNALPLGYGCIYNHSEKPNLSYEYLPEDKIFQFKTRRAIRAGEELFSYYGDKWFGYRNSKPRHRGWRGWMRKLLGFPLRAAIVIAAGWLVIRVVRQLGW